MENSEGEQASDRDLDQLTDRDADRSADNGAVVTMGERIRAKRQAKEISISELAIRLSVGTQTVLNWEANRSRPRATQHTILAGALGVPVGWLLSGAEFHSSMDTSFDTKQRKIDSKLDQISQLQASVCELVEELRADLADPRESKDGIVVGSTEASAPRIKMVGS